MMNTIEEDIATSRADIRVCTRPKPCESCEILERLLDALESGRKVARGLDLVKERLQNLQRDSLYDQETRWATVVLRELDGIMKEDSK